MTTSEIALDEAPSASTRRTAAGSVLPFGVTLLIVTLTYWTVDIISPALPEIKDDLALTAAGAGLVYSLQFLGRLLGNIPATLLVARLGAGMTGLAGGLLIAAGSLIAMTANGPSTLLPGRVVQGLGISLLVNAGLRSIISAKPGRGSAMTIFGFAATIGGVFGLQSGGFLTESSGWRSVFAVCAALGGLVALLSAANRFGRRAAANEPAIASAPAMPVAIRRNVQIAAFLLNLIVFVNYAIWVALPLYTEREFDTSAETNANLLLVITVMHLVAAFPAGRAIRRFGAIPTLAGGLVIAIAGSFLIVPMPSPLWLPLPLVLYGAGMLSAVNAAGDVVLHLGGGSARAVGVVRLSSDLGLVIGPWLAGSLADAFGYGAPFLVLPVLMIATLVFLLLRGRVMFATPSEIVPG